jgi:hypothetical protein
LKEEAYCKYQEAHEKDISATRALTNFFTNAAGSGLSGISKTN